MGVIVITGGTRGIGLGLARAFLERGQQVAVTGTSPDSVAAGLERLADLDAGDRLHGVPCDVRELPQVEALWTAAVERFGRVDHWINNAGVVNPPRPVAEMDAGGYADPVAVNLLGTFHGCAVAIRGMRGQDGGGTVWTMKGLGSDGRMVENSTPYATTKYAISYLTKALVKEVAGTPVRVCSIQPGMVATDMLRRSLQRYEPAERERVRKIFNTLADTVETVTPWIADRVLAGPGNGTAISWLTFGKVSMRFLLAPLRKREIFPAE